LFFSGGSNPSPNDFNINSEWFACVFSLYMRNIVLAAEYCRIVEIKSIGLFYRICDNPSITVFDGRNIFPVSFTPFYVSTKLSPAFTPIA